MLLFHGTNDNINRLVVKSDVSFGGLFCGTLGDAKAHGKNILVCKVNEADGINANSLAYEDGFYDICKELFANVADLELFDWFIDLLNADCNTQLDEQAEDSDEERAEKKSKREFLCKVSVSSRRLTFYIVSLFGYRRRKKSCFRLLAEINFRRVSKSPQIG